MKNSFTLFSGIFLTMALSNAIVPVLPAYAGTSSLSGAVYGAYFLGAFLSTLPAGMLSDRFGRAPLIRAGLLMTAVSGILLSLTFSPCLVLGLRFIEGIAAGCFVASAMSVVNSREDHERMSGYYMACLNAGLVTGLVLAGWLARHSGNPSAGILFFSGLALVPCISGFFMDDPGYRRASFCPAVFSTLFWDYRRLWFSSLVLVGITGVVSSIYPHFTGASADMLGYWIAGMSVATIGAVLVVSRASLPPVSAIRDSAVLMAAGVMVAFLSPWGFALLGALAGVAMIAQMAMLSAETEYQGIVMGLFSTTSYLGMTALPFIAGIVADTAGFLPAFSLTAALALVVALTIRGKEPEQSR